VETKTINRQHDTLTVNCNQGRGCEYTSSPGPLLQRKSVWHANKLVGNRIIVEEFLLLLRRRRCPKGG